PSLVMMLFTSIDAVVDGLFISNIVGETACAALNLIYHSCMLFGAVGSLFGVGGSALVALVKGRGERERANRIFSMLVYSLIVLGLILTVLSQLLLPSAARFFGARGEMLDNCLLYARIFLISLPSFILQYAFQSFLITAERPDLGLAFTVAAGVTNMVLDWLFIAVFRWGVAGASAATCIGQCVGGIGPLLFFIFSRSSSLKLVKAEFMPREFLKSASNGASDFITNIAISLTSIVFNWQLLKYIGEYGVSAYGIIMYVDFVFVAVYLGYSMGVAPVISYHYGTGKKEELRGLFNKSVQLVILASVLLTALALISAKAVARVFAGYDPVFLSISTRALRLYSLSYIFAGINIFCSNLYAALNNGLISGTLSALRLFVFQLIAVYLLPLILGIDGIWLSKLSADLVVFVITLAVLVRQRPRYGY
ncbi:MAG: polysaccharide biosynthesis C-terminal domain-containing protein, partial [Oscillospiraceae bacterium]|nr:polysaccharide biosynthesis C-terminal domain-containing protein [Oscillospiraceae bacterium]